MRLPCHPRQTAARTAPGFTLIELLVVIVARRCATQAEFDALQREVKNAAIIESDDGKVWRATTQIGDTNFEVARDIVNHLPLARRINGQEMHFDALAVNGRSLWPQGLAPRPQSTS